MAPELVNIFDTSLRDGLRKAGITLTIEQRCQFAQQLERLGVDVIEAGYGLSCIWDVVGSFVGLSHGSHLWLSWFGMSTA